MTDIDPKSDIELHTVNEHVIARVPLAGPVTGEWLRLYQRLARATGVLVAVVAVRRRRRRRTQRPGPIVNRASEDPS